MIGVSAHGGGQEQRICNGHYVCGRILSCREFEEVVSWGKNGSAKYVVRKVN